VSPSQKRGRILELGFFRQHNFYQDKKPHTVHNAINEQEATVLGKYFWVRQRNPACEYAENYHLSPCPPLRPTNLRFEFSKEAAIHNGQILQKYGYDIQWFIVANQESHISFGSKLRPLHVLDKLLCTHPK